MHDEDLLFARLGEPGDVHGEGRRASVVGEDGDAVEPEFRKEIDAVEMKEDALAGPCGRERHLAAVPDVVHEIDVPDAGKLRFRAERRDNLAVEEFLLPDNAALARGTGAVDGKIPRSVEIRPRRLAAELHSRVFRARNAL